jgi:hypothetical protein
MTTTTHEASAAPGRDDFRNPHAAGICEAMSLRFYIRYLEWRHSSEINGGEVGKYAPDDMATARGRYDELVQEWIFEGPSNARAVQALIDFATMIAVDQIGSDVMLDG